MSKSACLILGSCLALQAPIALSDFSGDFGSEAASETSSSSESASLPLFHQEHARELASADIADGDVVGDGDTQAQPQDMARFIYKKTRELLPVPFRGRSRLVAQALINAANEQQMDPLFLMAIINQESQFNPNALGSHGEIGLMQLKPSTAMTVASLRGLTDEQARTEVTEALKDPVQNIRLGAAYLARLRVSFKHRSTLYISAYNMGATRVRSHVAMGVEPRIYSSKVLAHYVELTDGVGATGGVSVASTALPTSSFLSRLSSHRELLVFGRTLDL